ncbi:MAG: hypothetical protein N2Z72_09065 [Bacteroidales bacterium]|nr:hypothetical protein [Bacteroidales bacterium]
MKTKVFWIFGVILVAGYCHAQLADVSFPKSCSVKAPKYGTDSVTTVKNFSIYRENFKQWKNSNYTNDAINYLLDPWRYCFRNAPLVSQNLYFDGLKIYEYFIKKEKDSIKKERYIDTLLLLYDRNIETFGCSKQYGEGYILGRKAVDMYEYRPRELDKIYLTLERSVKLQGKESESAVISLLYKITIDLVKIGKLDTSKVYTNYDWLIDLTLNKLADLSKEYKSAGNDTDKVRKKIEQYKITESNLNNLFEPWANCDMIIKIYGPKFDENQTNSEWLQRITSLLSRKGCTDSDLFFKSSEALYKINPSPESGIMLAKAFMRVKRFNDAIKYLNDAIPKLTDNESKFEANMTLANAHQALNQFSNARSAALNAISIKPNDPMPYILIGDLYMATASSCGDNEVAKRAGYWAAYDKYLKAKSLTQDEKLLGVINQKMGAAASGFPDNEKLFFYNLQSGMPYTINCWYSETTTVRSR